MTESKEKKKIVIGATGASGFPVLLECLRIIRENEEYQSVLIMSDSAKLTAENEINGQIEKLYDLADHLYGVQEIGAGPASGTFKTEGMLIVPCSMKTLAGIHSGYAETLLLRAADVTIKEQRLLVLGIRENPLSYIHLRNMIELSTISKVHIMPLMLTFYNKEQTIDEMVYHVAAKLLNPFGIDATNYKRWKGL